jgi:DNA-binding XRE family transcriptional regulator
MGRDHAAAFRAFGFVDSAKTVALAGYLRGLFFVLEATSSIFFRKSFSSSVNQSSSAIPNRIRRAARWWGSGREPPRTHSETFDWLISRRSASHAWVWRERLRARRAAAGVIIGRMHTSMHRRPSRCSYASLHSASAYGLPVPRGSDLTPEENERVRVALRQLLERHGKQTALAPRLGVNQSTLSGILTGRQGASYQLAVAAARLLGTDAADLLAGPRGRALDRRALAAELAREDGVLEAAIDDVLAEPLDEHLSTLSWALRMKRREAELLDRGAGSAAKPKIPT